MLIFSAVCENFCMNFYAAVKRWNIHFITKFCWHNFTEVYWQIYTVVIMTTPISQWSERCLPRLSDGGSEKSLFVGDKMRTQTLRRAVTAAARSDRCRPPQPRRHSSVCSSPPPCCCVLVAALPRWSSLRVTFNSSIALGFGWSLWYFSSMACQTWESSGFKSGEFGATHSS